MKTKDGTTRSVPDSAREPTLTDTAPSPRWRGVSAEQRREIIRRCAIGPRVWRALQPRLALWLDEGYATTDQVVELRGRLDRWLEAHR